MASSSCRYSHIVLQPQAPVDPSPAAVGSHAGRGKRAPRSKLSMGESRALMRRRRDKQTRQYRAAVMCSGIRLVVGDPGCGCRAVVKLEEFQVSEGGKRGGRQEEIGIASRH